MRLYFEMYRVLIVLYLITDTPYGTTIFFPLTKKIMRHCSIIDGDIHVFIQYVQWLQRQCESPRII